MSGVSLAPWQTIREHLRTLLGSTWSRRIFFLALSFLGLFMLRLAFGVSPLPTPWDSSPPVISSGDKPFGFDALSYWQAHGGPDSYAGTQTTAGIGVWRYAPLWLPLLAPFQHLSFPAFAYLMAGLELGALIYLTRRYFLVAMIFIPVPLELYEGNIALLLTAAIVFALRNTDRRPTAALFYPVLFFTKVLPFIVVGWHLIRREWRPAGLAIGASLILLVIGYALDPVAWGDWFRSLVATQAVGDNSPMGLSLPVREVLALGLLVWGARRGWTSLVVMAAFLSMPSIWFQTYSMLIALPITLRADYLRSKMWQSRSEQNGVPNLTPSGAASATDVDLESLGRSASQGDLKTLQKEILRGSQFAGGVSEAEPAHPVDLGKIADLAR